MVLTEKFHSYKNKIYKNKKFTAPENFKKHPYYNEIKIRIEDAISKGFTFGPVVHYGFDLDSYTDINDFNDAIDKNHKGNYGYGGIGGAPGGIFFSIAEGNDSDYYNDLIDNNSYKNNPFASRYFANSIGPGTGGIVCMLKIEKYCELYDYIKRGILDDEFYGYIIDETYFPIVKRFLKKAFHKANEKEIQEIYRFLEDYSIRKCDGDMPTFLSGSFDTIFSFFEELPNMYINLVDKNFLKAIKTKNINKAQTFILSSYGYEPLIDVNGELICYDMNRIYVCGKTPDTEFLKKWNFNDPTYGDKHYNKGYE